MTNAILQFFGGDPVVAWALTLSLCFTIAACVIVGRSIYQERQQQKADEDFRETMRAMLHEPEPMHWPRPAKKTDQPWRHRRSA